MKKKICLLLFILFILLVQNAAAQDIIGSILGAFKKLGWYIVEALVQLLMLILKSYISMIEASILSNPDVSMKDVSGNLTPHGNIMAIFLEILVPIYILGILVTAIYMIFISESPEGRAHAKSMLEKYLVSMVVVSAAPGIYLILLYTSEVLARGIIGTITGTIMQETTLGDAMYTAIADLPTATKISFIFVFAWILMATVFALLVVWFRYLMVMLCAIIFPFTLFLYLFEFTRHLGARLLKFTLVWIYTPMISALFLAIGVVVLKTTTEQQSFIADIIAPIFFMATMAMVGIAPLVLSGLMRWLGGIIAMVGMMIPGAWGIALAAVGGVMQGKSAGAIAAAGLRVGAKNIWKSAGQAKGAAKKAAAGPKPEKFGAAGGPGAEGGKAGAAGAGAGAAGAKGGRLAGMGAEAKGDLGAVKRAGDATGKAAGKAVEAGGRGLGSAMGAAVGSVVPGAGTAAGAKVGGQIGGAVGKVAGKGVEYGIKGAAKVGVAAGKAAKWGAKGADYAARPGKSAKALAGMARDKLGKPKPTGAPGGPKAPLTGEEAKKTKEQAETKTDQERLFKDELAYPSRGGRPSGPSTEQVMDGMDEE